MAEHGCRVFKDITYTPGTLEAVALDLYGKEVGRTELKSAAKGTTVQLSADKEILYANGQDICFIDLCLTDENGFCTGTYTTYHGRALIAVRAGYQAGEATVTVKAEGLEPVEISVRVMERQGFFREDFSSPS